mmetsp:Transcript_58120/g.147425  ORF Transcript_58120/g.147425 Transcript_58120/m.147425 type:complete len:208 (+) Transcript_58120:1367-1990(+)
MHPGSSVRKGAPWSGVKGSPFCLKASNTSRSRSSAHPIAMDVPYDPVDPCGSSPKGPSKCTYWCCSLTLVMPRYASTSHSRTPVQTLLATAPAPQLKPMVFFVIFCSLRRFPAQMKVTGMLTTGPTLPEASSSMLKSQDRGTPETCKRCVFQDNFGTAPWFRTTCKAAGVTQPASCNLRSGGSELKGWRPVRRTMSGCRFTQSSGVS